MNCTNAFIAYQRCVRLCADVAKKPWCAEAAFGYCTQVLKIYHPKNTCGLCHEAWEEVRFIQDIIAYYASKYFSLSPENFRNFTEVRKIC